MVRDYIWPQRLTRIIWNCCAIDVYNNLYLTTFMMIQSDFDSLFNCYENASAQLAGREKSHHPLWVSGTCCCLFPADLIFLWNSRCTVPGLGNVMWYFFTGWESGLLIMENHNVSRIILRILPPLIRMSLISSLFYVQFILCSTPYVAEGVNWWFHTRNFRNNKALAREDSFHWQKCRLSLYHVMQTMNIIQLPGGKQAARIPLNPFSKCLHFTSSMRCHFEINYQNYAWLSLELEPESEFAFVCVSVKKRQVVRLCTLVRHETFDSLMRHMIEPL